MSADVAVPLPVPVADPLRAAFQRLRDAFQAHSMPLAEERRRWLDALAHALRERRETLTQAISADFGNRAADETLLAELIPSLHGLRYARRRLGRWMKPSRRRVGPMFQPASARVVYQPLGVVGVIVPWNYPLFLAIGPLTGALAAGNRVMLKLSEATPHASRALAELLAATFPEDLVCVVQGDAEVGAAFSRLPFDHLLFTGSTEVGRHVMRAAADSLTPVTLELGGKSPAIVSADVPLAHAAERIAFGKCLNAGQTCVAPDYALVPRARLDGFVAAYADAVRRFYPGLAGNPDYTSVINPRQAARLADYLADAEARGARVLPLLPGDGERRLPPTVLLEVNDEMRVMREEIFGPLLPVVPYDHLDDAIAYVNRRPRPLALYYFGYDRDGQEQVLARTHSGGACLNDTLLHVAQDDLPFGGIGPSGMGHYHGHEGFLTFSQAKAVFAKGRFNAARLIYPPYGRAIQSLVYRLFLR